MTLYTLYNSMDEWNRSGYSKKWHILLHHKFIISVKSHRVPIRYTLFLYTVNLKKNISCSEKISTKKNKLYEWYKWNIHIKNWMVQGHSTFSANTTYNHSYSHSSRYRWGNFESFPSQLLAEHTVNDVWNMHFWQSKIKVWLHGSRHVCLLPKLIRYCRAEHLCNHLNMKSADRHHWFDKCFYFRGVQKLNCTLWKVNMYVARKLWANFNFISNNLSVVPDASMMYINAFFFLWIHFQSK